ncbi:MAG: PIN domain-containing protein [Candidatus Riflebacteria bacterium]|nr:PIN domain-containing protein [Candidatus Riflebacteria bacterium]
MSDRVFLDTNVLVYAFDEAEPAKKARAIEILGTWEKGATPAISTQVLQEFYVSVVRKLKVPLSEEDAEAAVLRLCRLPVVQVDPAVVLGAIRTSRRLRLSFWDALVVQAALEAGCKRLLTEDLQDGLLIDGVLLVENPFVQRPR